MTLFVVTSAQGGLRLHIVASVFLASLLSKREAYNTLLVFSVNVFRKFLFEPLLTPKS